ncbi:MAG: Ig-like domain-containing protein [Patescibacteria group bacterium]|nr:Ig-like domain-containing protein [Patescibacteria group bacterium]
MHAAKKIPTVLGLGLVIVLTIGVALTTRAAGSLTNLFSSASGQKMAADVGVANFNNSGATIYWTTDTPTTGTVSFGKTSALEQGLVVDDRAGQYLTHFVRLTGLAPATKYFYKISDDVTVRDFTTLAGPLSGTADPIYGQVTDASGGPLAGAIAVWTGPASDPLAALSKSDGNYVLPVVAPAGSAETVTLLGGAGVSATITCQVGMDRPLPTVAMGDSLDCQKKTTTTSPGFKTPAAPASPSPTAGSAQLNIDNGQTFDTFQPVISGKAGPNQVVNIMIHSDTPYSATVVAGPDGSWSWTPPANLSAGQHTVTITITNPDGTTQTVTRTFTVTAGTSLLPITSGTPSATLTHLACVNNACTTISGAGSDACSTDSDCVATAAATPAPPPPPSAPPTTGATENTVIMLTLGLIFVTLGAWKKIPHRQ